MHAQYSFYVPHDRVVYDGTMIDPATGEIVTPPRRVKQSHVAECDINNIIKQYKMTGQIRHISAQAAKGTYADLPDPEEFQESMNRIIQAEASFASLPSRVRARFGNDPAMFLEFMANPSNVDEMITLGLATKAPEPATEAGGVPPPPPPAGQ